MVNPLISPAILSLCPGILGLEEGIERTIGRTRTVAYVEIETFIVENLLVAMEAGILAPAPVYANLKQFNPLPFRNKVSWVVGGYPCQPFSHAGKRRGNADPRHLWPYIYACLYFIRPPVVFFENVAGHLSCGYEEVRRDLLALGYTVKEGIYSAAEVGAPHLRKRLFILGLLADPSSGDGCGPNWPTWWDEFTGSRKAVANAENQCWGRKSAFLGDPRRSGESVNATAGIGGENVAYATSNGGSRRSGEVRSEDGRQIEQLYAESINTGELANGIGSGLEEWKIEQARRQCTAAIGSSGIVEPSERAWAEPGRPFTGMGRFKEQFPAGPGQPQYEWEHPRTIESRLGCTIDGYSFREDLLRALGNSVVPAQAAFALNGLLNQHFAI